MSIKTDWLISISIVLSCILIFLICVLGWYQFIDGTFYKPPIVFESTVFQTEKCSYFPGDIIRAKAKFVKNRNINGKIKWNLVDNRLFEYTQKTVSLPIGNYDILIDIAKIPDHLPSTDVDEMWSFKGIVEYKINPIKIISIALETTEFKIIPKKNGDNIISE